MSAPSPSQTLLTALQLGQLLKSGETSGQGCSKLGTTLSPLGQSKLKKRRV